MSDKIFDDMRKQMIPDQELLDRLDKVLAAEAAATDQVSKPVLAAVHSSTKPSQASPADPSVALVIPKPKHRGRIIAAAACLATAVLAFVVLFNASALLDFFQGGGLTHTDKLIRTGPVAIYTPADYKTVYDEIAAFQRQTGQRNGVAGNAGGFGMMIEDSVQAPTMAIDPKSTAGPPENLGPQSYPENEINIPTGPGQFDNNVEIPGDNDPDRTSDPDDPDNTAVTGDDDLADPGTKEQDDTTVDGPQAHSETNKQVNEVDEGDIVKTDGRYIYTLSRVWQDNRYVVVLSIHKAAGVGTLMLSQIVLCDSNTAYSDDLRLKTDSGLIPPDNVTYQEMFIFGNTLAVISTITSYNSDFTSNSETRVELIDARDPISPNKVWQYSQSGQYNQARLLDGKLYVISSFYIYTEPDPDDPSTFVPAYRVGNSETLCPPDRIAIMPVIVSIDYAVIGSIDIAGRRPIDQVSVLGGATTVYMNTQNLFIASGIFDEIIGEPYRESVYTVTEYTNTSRTQLTR
ncbi:MAG: beta-propeller domain-containing protein, partial [Coriobacteriales bacterium]|nr:beta-propeller domain-containing protein [Coriobacteriales bacterium]